jgi:nucleoside-diphosphate-sugar epimerase
MMRALVPGSISRRASDIVAADLDDCCRRLGSDLSQMAGRRVLLTGGAGFLGYYLVLTLIEWNRRVARHNRIELTIVDNCRRGVPAWLQHASAERCQLLSHDVTIPLPPSLGSFDYFIHAASIASPTFYREQPLATMDANVTGLRLLLERIRRQQDSNGVVSGCLFFSSSEVYGDAEPGAIPTPETYPGRVSSTGPRACYDESKRYGETLCVVFAQQYGVPVTMVRPFNNYGPGLRMTDRRVIPDFAGNLLAGADLAVHSDGTPTRTFCYIADAIVGYYKALLRGRPGEAYNIGCDSPEISINELAERIAAAGRELFAYSGQVVRQPNPDPRYLVDNPQRRCPDVTKARSELGFVAAIGLDDGLRRSLVWYSENGDGRVA